MAYIGNTGTTQTFTPAIDYFSGNGSTTAFTLSRPVASVAQIQVTINNVAQNPSSAYTVNGSTLTFTSAPLSGSSNIYVYYTSPNTQVIAPSQGTVGTAQLTSDLQNANYGFKNRIINGAMVIDQRNAGAAVTITGGAYTLDRWQIFATQASKFTVQQNASSVTPPAGYTNYLGATVGASANVTVGAGDYFSLSQAIEGFNTADFSFGTASASAITLSFWVRSSLTGTFGGNFYNDSAARIYGFLYTINAANTWEQKTITVAGDTSGTWLTTNGRGLVVLFTLGAGSTNGQGTTGAWTSTKFAGPTGATNWITTNSATFYITGVQLEKGSTATSFDYRPYGTELALCQRYYYKYSVTSSDQSFGSGYNYGTTNFIFNTKFPVSMRTAPSALEQTGTAGDYKVLYLSSTAVCTSVPTFSSANVNSADSFWTVAAVLTAGQGGLPRSSNANAFHAWSTEL